MTDDYLELMALVERLTWYLRGIVALFVISVLATAYLLFSKREEDDES